MVATAARPEAQHKLLAQVTCPHCWHRFAPEQVLWIAEHAELHEDPLLDDAQWRFPPSRFTPGGDAIDARGMPCQKLACPACHLPLHRAALETEALFVSIVGAHTSGKSYFLATMVQQLETALHHDFGVVFDEPDPGSNAILRGYMRQLFENPRPDRPVDLGDLIRKTELAGNEYDQVGFGEQRVSFPKPFLFSLAPQPDRHPNGPKGGSLTRLLYLYDNSGEHFEPINDNAANPGTRHLGKAGAILFLFDPTQDPEFRSHCRGEVLPGRHDGPLLSQQARFLTEAAARARSHGGLAANARYEKPLIIVLTKSDQWSNMLPDDDEVPWVRRGEIAGLKIGQVQRRSQELRALMMKYCPQTVAAAERFAKDVTYIAVSALGDKIEVDPVTKIAAIRPRNIRPERVALPMLYALNLALPGLILGIKGQ